MVADSAEMGRHPFSKITLDQLQNSSIRMQDNNLDTIVTLGVKECLSAKKVRVYSDTGAWKQTALRAALFSEPDVEYPLTRDTARHPISEHPERGG